MKVRRIWSKILDDLIFRVIDTTFTMGTLHLRFAQEVFLLQLLHILFPGTKHHTLGHQERIRDLLLLFKQR